MKDSRWYLHWPCVTCMTCWRRCRSTGAAASCETPRCRSSPRSASEHRLPESTDSAAMFEGLSTALIECHARGIAHCDCAFPALAELLPLVHRPFTLATQ